MNEYTEKIVDVATGKETLRPYTDEEIAAVEAIKKQRATEQAEREAIESAKAEQRAALLERLGITAEEAKLLLG